ncbi:hypothetical protein HK096_008108, partial [Nowakowskiella sp. JEL0078]
SEKAELAVEVKTVANGVENATKLKYVDSMRSLLDAVHQSNNDLHQLTEQEQKISQLQKENEKLNLESSQLHDLIVHLQETITTLTEERENLLSEGFDIKSSQNSPKAKKKSLRSYDIKSLIDLKKKLTFVNLQLKDVNKKNSEKIDYLKQKIKEFRKKRNEEKKKSFLKTEKKIHYLKKEIEQNEIVITDLTFHLKKLGNDRSTSLTNNGNRSFSLTSPAATTENRNFSVIQHELKAELTELHESLESETTNLLTRINLTKFIPVECSVEEKVAYFANQLIKICENRDSLLEVIRKSVESKESDVCVSLMDHHSLQEQLNKANTQHTIQLQEKDTIIASLIEDLNEKQVEITAFEDSLGDHDSQHKIDAKRIAWFQSELEKTITDRDKILLELEGLRASLITNNHSNISDDLLLLKVKLRDESSTKLKLSSQLVSLEVELLSAVERIAILTILLNSAQNMLDDVNVELVDAFTKAENAERDVDKMENWIEKLLTELDMVKSKLEANLVENEK